MKEMAVKDFLGEITRLGSEVAESTIHMVGTRSRKAPQSDSGKGPKPRGPSPDDDVDSPHDDEDVDSTHDDDDVEQPHGGRK